MRYAVMKRCSTDAGKLRLHVIHGGDGLFWATKWAAAMGLNHAPHLNVLAIFLDRILTIGSWSIIDLDTKARL